METVYGNGFKVSINATDVEIVMNLYGESVLRIVTSHGTFKAMSARTDKEVVRIEDN